MPHSNSKNLNIRIEDHEKYVAASERLSVPMVDLAGKLIEWFNNQNKLTQLAVLGIIDADDVGIPEAARVIMEGLTKEHERKHNK